MHERHRGLVRRRIARAALAAVLLLSLLPASGSAHIRTTARYAEIRQEGAMVRSQLALEYRPLAAAVGLGKRAVSGAPGERAALLRDRRAALQSYLAPRVTVSVDGVECEGAMQGAGMEEREGRSYARILLVHECPGSGSGAYKLRYGVFSDRDAVVDDHTSIADYAFADGKGTFVFDAGHHELAVGKTGLLSSGYRFTGMGIHRILSGLDHVLFLVAVLLGAQGLVSVLKLATTFTVAHSMTLALGALGWVDVPSEIVEPLIALSIVYVAVENIVGGESRHGCWSSSASACCTGWGSPAR